MNQRSAHLQSSQLFQALLKLHHEDTPSLAEREHLLSLVPKSGLHWVPHKPRSQNQSDVGQAAPKPQVHGVAAGVLADDQNGKWSPPLVALSVALAGLFVLWAMAFGAQSQSTQPAASTPGAPPVGSLGRNGGQPTAPAALAHKSCFIATGDRGLLWNSSQTTPDLARVDGRSGRFLHQLATQAEDLRRPARVVEDAARSGHRWLQATGERATGWGAKLSSALRLSAGARPGAIRFDCYDASAYAGVRFRARGKGIVLVLLQTSASVPLELGGQCESKCWFTASHALALGDTTKEYRLTWDRFGTSHQSRRPESHLMMLEFLVQRGPDPYQIVVEEMALMTEAEAQAPH